MVLSPDLPEPLFGHGPPMGSLTVLPLRPHDGGGFEPLVGRPALELHHLLVAQAAEPGHLDHRLQKAPKNKD
ncbi:hypothetical protein AVEN_83022-1 [Araneus ventricosus]|uniref:Uncharacterized protein n=1 Tax=Araneus ventricosus TaxID=182803 RepID=A0A4Y2SR34_ARAVE|nr:hypothetical protein AVEN_83022-1 [Araneus ventricosus]